MSENKTMLDRGFVVLELQPGEIAHWDKLRDADFAFRRLKNGMFADVIKSRHSEAGRFTMMQVNTMIQMDRDDSVSSINGTNGDA